MAYGIHSCDVCLSINYDVLYNNNAVMLLQELFPDVSTPGSIVLCRDCCSMLDMYRNINQLLRDHEIKFKQTESNVMNIAHFIMWLNGGNHDLNEEKKCEICSKIIDYEDLKWVGHEIILHLFPKLDSAFCSNIKLCKLCKNVLVNLTTFKLNYSKMTSELPDYSKDFEDNYVISSTSSNSSCNSDDTKESSLLSNFTDLNGSGYWYTKREEKKYVNYKVFLLGKQIKPMKRNGVHLYSCPKCEKIVMDLGTHFEIHKEMFSDLLFSCEICDFQHQSFYIIQTHQCKTRQFSGISEKIYKCKLCIFQTKQKGNLKTHSLIHKSTNEIQMYKCDQCNYESRQKGNLKTHKLKHLPKDEIKMYKCSHCFFEAKQKGNLQTHMLKKHKNINEVELDEVLCMKCKICSFSTKQRKMFVQHMEEHN